MQVAAAKAKVDACAVAALGPRYALEQGQGQGAQVGASHGGGGGLREALALKLQMDMDMAAQGCVAGPVGDSRLVA